mmetsp:Transcript_25474/g.67239  ORF Transcript_25474/g.67239 Transcript_25474/m.67239 type:complete len:232 (-) Transcript_25474:735-1430(-)
MECEPASRVLAVRTVARLAAAHVVLLAARLERQVKLAPELQEADREEDLRLCVYRQRVPLRGGAARSCNVGERRAVERLLPREDDVVLLHNEAHERRHRDASVLDLSLPKEANRGLLALAPEVVPVTQPKGVEIPDVGVTFSGEDLEVLDGLHHDAARALHRRGARGERRGHESRGGERRDRQHYCATLEIAAENRSITRSNLCIVNGVLPRVRNRQILISPDPKKRVLSR